MALVNGVGVLLLQLDIILLGVLGSAADVGVYAIATRIALLVGLAEYAVTRFPPFVARYHATLQYERLRRTAAAVAAAGLAGAAILAAPVLIFPEQVLSIFGSEFESGATQLRLLALSWIVSAMAGQNGALLSMSQRNGAVVAGSAIAPAANLALNVALIPEYGSLGAAWAWLLTTALWNVVLAVAVKRAFGFYATPLALINRH